MSETTTLERPRTRGARGLTGAILLIGVGTAILLSNLGVASFDWLTLARFWPLALVLIGLDVLLGRSVLGSLAAAALGVALVAGALILTSMSGPQPFVGNLVTRDVAHELGGAESLEAELVLGAASAHVDAGAAGGQAVAGSYRTRERLVMDERYAVSGGRGTFTFVQNEDDDFGWTNAGLLGDLNLSLTDEVLVDLRVTAGAGDTRLDLSGMQLTSLDLNAGVGNVALTLPDAGDYTVTVSGGVGNFEVTVPPGMEARVEIDGMTVRDVPGRFDKVTDGLWQTDGYDSAANRATIHVTAGVGNVTIR